PPPNAGAAGLHVEEHPNWTPKQVKSALMSTARPAFADTAATTEAPVTLEGAGLAWLPSADDPKIFTDPQSLSFQDLDVADGGKSKSIAGTISDARGGAGPWAGGLSPHAATPGAGGDVGPPGASAARGPAAIPNTPPPSPGA